MAPPPQSASDFIDFLNASPTPFHAVANAARMLEGAGFVKLRERDDWAAGEGKAQATTRLQPGGKYYVTRNGSSIVAFAVGGRWQPGGPVGMVGAHTDSPCLRVKPVSRKTASGFLQVAVETYGGAIWHSWFDRDLSLAGRVFVRERGSSGDGEGTIVQRLVKVDRPLLRIPHLAIHLHRNPEFNPNKENELCPIAGLAADELNGPEKGEEGDATNGKKGEEDEAGSEVFHPLKTLSERHHASVVEVIAEHAGVPVSDVEDFELVLYDTQKACLGGLRDEFIFGARLDNLCMTYCSVAGLIASVQSPDASVLALQEDRSIRLAACFDHEEVGSLSAQGADSNLLPAVLSRICTLGASSSHDNNASGAINAEALLHRSMSASFLVSADMAHSVNPNYEAKYEARHRPEMNKGPVVKVNAGQKYATNAPGVVLVREAARLATASTSGNSNGNSKSGGVPLQLFVVRNDSPCGTTIGPMLAAKLGVRTLDLGNPQLSMHSIRETAGSHDVEHAIRLFASFWASYGDLEGRILVD